MMRKNKKKFLWFGKRDQDIVVFKLMKYLKLSRKKQSKHPCDWLKRIENKCTLKYEISQRTPSRNVDASDQQSCEATSDSFAKVDDFTTFERHSPSNFQGSNFKAKLPPRTSTSNTSQPFCPSMEVSDIELDWYFGDPSLIQKDINKVDSTLK
ncbi:uncharacterized protein [Cicer arietinum]|uniref:Uncharacterized protein LOC101505845 n=1 Tax=Cicer arietinum TaxID=3827 RepID=A0A1S2Z259_CICAR|nr:uncharacterized protein LOC101505845 [Cicer arietinum]